MKKRKLMYAISMILCTIIITASCVMVVLSANSQNVTSSLSVTFSGQNVNYNAQAWYQVAGSSSRTALKDSSNTSNSTLTFSATEQSATKTLAVIENSGVVNLSVNNTYVLFTYKFTNTASTGAYGMEITLTGSASSDSNMTVKYLSSTSDYTVSSSGLTTQSGLVTSTTPFDHVFVGAGQTKYLYILVSLVDPCLNGSYNKSSSGLSFAVTCSENKTEAGYYTVTCELVDFIGDNQARICSDNWDSVNTIVGSNISCDSNRISLPAGTTILISAYTYGTASLTINGTPTSWNNGTMSYVKGATANYGYSYIVGAPPIGINSYTHSFVLNANVTIIVTNNS